MVWCKNMGADEKVSEVIFKECSTIMESDECETAAKIGFCLRDVAMKHKINVDF